MDTKNFLDLMTKDQLAELNNLRTLVDSLEEGSFEQNQAIRIYQKYVADFAIEQEKMMKETKESFINNKKQDELFSPYIYNLTREEESKLVERIIQEKQVEGVLFKKRLTEIKSKYSINLIIFASMVFFSIIITYFYVI